MNILFNVFIPICIAITTILACSLKYKEAPLLKIEKSTQICPRDGLNFHIGYESSTGAVTHSKSGYIFRSNAYIQAHVCSPGMLAIDGYGNSANGVNAQLNVDLNENHLGTFEVTSNTTRRYIRIPTQGILTLAFLNDYYEADVRLATFEDMVFTGSNCHSMEVFIPKENGGKYFPNIQKAFIVSSIPMMITPCSSGYLTLKISGRVGNKAGPELVFTQDRTEILKISADNTKRKYRIELKNSPLSIQLTNPYGKTVADRNLIIKLISFHPF